MGDPSDKAVKAGGEAVSANYAYAAGIPRKYVFVAPEDMAYDVLVRALATGHVQAFSRDALWAAHLAASGLRPLRGSPEGEKYDLDLAEFVEQARAALDAMEGDE